jgi:glycosyltransferase involved in cell wall biosynthesis
MDIAVPATPEVSIIVPARNEEVCLGDCLQSLVGQTGVAFEIIVVDDHSTDRTRAIAESLAGVRVIAPGPLPEGWTGKNNAVVAGAREARGEWLLFTDADTVHVAGSLARALAEAKENRADLLSYSPEQKVETFWERAVMPVVFAELASQYPPEKVRDQSSGVVAANGQYMLVHRAAYEALGGHAAVADKILEDVALARAFRSAGYRVYFRYGADAVRARMYRSWSELREGWTKNLALLFPRPMGRAITLLVWWAVAWLALPLLVPVLALYLRVRQANFAFVTSLVAVAFGPPLFGYLLMRSVRAHALGKVLWKGRTYAEGASGSEGKAPVRPSEPVRESMVESRAAGN